MDKVIDTKLTIDEYTSKAYHFFREYMDTQISEKDKDNMDNGIYNTFVFTGLLDYIKKHMPKIPYEDIDLLDGVFNIYIDLCNKFRQLPSLEGFSILCDVSTTTMTNWGNGLYRSGSPHLATFKKWREKCKNMLVNDLQNSQGASVNKIFVAKAAYGMVETAPVQTINEVQLSRSVDQIAADYGLQITQKQVDNCTGLNDNSPAKPQ